MNLLSGIFIMVVAILVVSSICLGFIICYFITQRNRDTGRQAETSTPSIGNPRNNETQLDRIERSVKRATLSSKYLAWISLSVAALAIGGAGLEISLWGRILLVILGIAVILGTSLRIYFQKSER